MNALESHLEALAFNYLTYGFLSAVNNIWAWFAVITAAVRFWRIRDLSSATPEPNSSSPVAVSTSSSPQKVVEMVAKKPATDSKLSDTQLLSAPTTKTSCPMLEREGGTKTKFSVYFEDDEEFKEDDDGGERASICRGGAAVMTQKWWFDDWERIMVRRMGDIGWYRWQDTTVLDGSVVRLWEWRRRRRRQAEAFLVDDGVMW